MTSRTRPRITDRCPRCVLRPEFCLCVRITPVSARTRVRIVRHQLEAAKWTNTARIAQLAVPSIEVVDHGRSSGQDIVQAERGWALLWPDGGATVDPGAVTGILMLDGTWSQARHMLGRIRGVAALPRLALPPAADVARIRRAPPGGMSTIEALALALGLVESPALRDALLYAHGLHVQGIQAARGVGVRNPDVSVGSEDSP